jgi:hypothetical protein
MKKANNINHLISILPKKSYPKSLFYEGMAKLAKIKRYGLEDIVDQMIENGEKFELLLTENYLNRTLMMEGK